MYAIRSYYGQYHIRSLYFDDVYETALKDKVAGTDERCKYRVRIYNYNDSVIKFVITSYSIHYTKLYDFDGVFQQHIIMIIDIVFKLMTEIQFPV